METPSYEVTRKLDDIEIRRYPPLFLSTAKGDADLFGLLFRYISGANKGSSKISMTAPVITPEEISMTPPVVTDADSMSFIVPSKYTCETIPEPTDPNITINEQPARSLAVLRFSGWARSGTVNTKKRLLLETLSRGGVKVEASIPDL